MKKRILMPVLEAGAGHKMSALAVKEALDELFPDQFQIEVVDLARVAGALTADHRLKALWDFALRHPAWARFGYRLTELPFAKLNLHVFFREFVTKGMAFIQAYQPDLIFSTHFYCLTISALARERYRLPFKLAGCVIDPNPFWNEPRVDKMVVDPVILKDFRILNAIEPEKIIKMSFPISKRFAGFVGDRVKLLEKYGLEPGKKTVLASLGGQGIGPLNSYVIAAYQQGIPVNILAVCAKNEGQKKILEKLVASQASVTHLAPLGYVENMEELVFLADVVAGKGGPSTTFEALAMHKPLLYTHWATYTEKPLIDYVVAKRAGWFVNNQRDFLQLLEKILSDPQILAEYRRNVEALSFSSGAREIAVMLRDLV